MGTYAPVKRTINIPIEDEPTKPLALPCPLALPYPLTADKVYIPANPIKVPVKV